jgi:hypothetical protein
MMWAKGSLCTALMDGGCTARIRFGCEMYKEANIEYSDTILGTLFPRKLGVILDFSSPGSVQIGDENILIGQIRMPA